MRLLLYFFIGFLIFRFIGSLFRPRRTQQQTYQRNFHSRNDRKEGEVSVNVSAQKQKKQFSNKEGDYVDYEEI